MVIDVVKRFMSLECDEGDCGGTSSGLSGTTGGDVGLYGGVVDSSAEDELEEEADERVGESTRRTAVTSTLEVDGKTALE